MAAATADAAYTSRPFGKTDVGVATTLHTVTNENGTTIALLDYGATLQSVRLRDRKGDFTDVVFGFDDVAGYQSDANGYFGCTVGRYANRIASGRFELDGTRYQLATNNDPNHLHGGGKRSFDKVVWKAKRLASAEGEGIVFSYISVDEEEGYPGNVSACVRYTLTPDDRIVIEYSASTDAPTIINLTNHSYFNLSGAGSRTINDHILTIDADYYTPVDATLIPTGEIRAVAGTPFDFRKPRAIGERVEELGKAKGAGYDHNFVLRPLAADQQERRAARLHDPASGRTLEVWTDQPGVQFYGGNFLGGQAGKRGQTYAFRSGCCLETQLFPDSPNKPDWPSPVLRPGQDYRHTCVYAFSVD